MGICPIGIVDDKMYNVQILTEKLEAKPGVKITMSAFNGQAFLYVLPNLTPLPEIIFMDIDMPLMDGIEAVKQAKILFPQIHFIMITVFDDEERIFAAIQAGASGYLLKDESIANLHLAIDNVLEFGAAPLAPAIAKKAYNFIQNQNKEASAAETTPLSSREMDILNCLAQGKSYTIIADELFISPHTVRKHMTNIYEKLHVNSKVEAVRLAMQKKWV
ncbi:MAG: two component transcriptional regulator, LuxR family [Fluviicola sp.]|jgi:DNA-binding NarL/FixJ family response regulator|uniref:response regulator transcription factor n=1 Tax=Fluviicola sp. TaxID=1917219 RepID=UPI00260FBD68|nr:response regulator transcription factor [Fluviicola sp.]MDF3028751.1 two component transcriptional regulator, LuxR family [Fluviicola sp.]